MGVRGGGAGWGGEGEQGGCEGRGSRVGVRGGGAGWGGGGAGWVRGEGEQGGCEGR